VSSDPLAQLAANVRAARERSGLSQEAVAQRAGLALSDVGRIERRERDPGVRVLVRLARGLGVTAAELFEGVEWQPESARSDRD
jgi:transcriptional regulator with XRE-family HTH domain